MKKLIKLALKITSIISVISVINSRIKMDNDFSTIDVSFHDDKLYYNSKNGNIHYTIDGNDGSKKPKMLLIHSLMIGGGLHEYAKLSKNLSEDFEVYRIDMLGFGHSDKPDIQYNSYLYTSLINSFINDVINDDVFVLASGNSADFAFMSREFDNRFIKHLFMINPEGLEQNSVYGDLKSVVSKHLFKLPVIGTFLVNMLGTRPSIRKNLLDKCFFNLNSVTPAMVNEYFYNAHYNCASNRFSLAHLLTNFLNIDSKTKLISTEKETTIILGENCESFDSYTIKKQLDQNRNIRTMIIPLSRKLVATEKPDEVYSAVISHL